MINLDAMMNKTIDFQIKGELIKVQQLSYKMTKRLVKISSLEESEIVEEQVKLVTEILNNNTSSKKFTQEDIEELPVAVVIAVISEMMKTINKADNDPN